MILVITRMKILFEKRMELSQTIAALSGSISMDTDADRQSNRNPKGEIL